MRKSLVFSAFASAVLLLAGCAGSSNEGLIVSGIPFDDTQNVADSYSIFIDLLKEETGREVSFYQSPDYSTATEALISGQVDIAQLSSFSYIMAKERNSDLILLGASGRNSTDLPGYFSYGVKRAGDETVSTLEQLKGKRVCFSDPSSGAGYLWPAKYLAEAELNPDPSSTSDFTPVFVDTFPQVAQSVISGDCDAGFLLDVFYDKTLVTSELVDITKLDKFWESNVSPGIPLVLNPKRFSDQQIDEIQQMVVEQGNKDYLISAGICSDRESCNFLSDAAWGYLEVEDSFYDELRDLCRILELEECQK